MSAGGEAEIGDEIPPIEVVVRGDDVRRYSTVARMPGPRFYSDEAARKEGLPGQILPGNLSMSLLSKLVLDWLPAARLEKLGVTFRGLVFPDKPIRLSGFVTERHVQDDKIVLECDLVLECEGERRVTGVATLVVDRR